MIALILVVALAGSAVSTPAFAGTPKRFVVEFSSSTNPDHAAHQFLLMQKAGLKDVRTVSSPLLAKRHIYRIVSRRFSTYGEARLALLEARRLMAKAHVPFRGVVLDADKAGAPIIR